MSGKAPAADPAEYIKKPDPEADANNGAVPEEPEPVRFSPEEEAVSSRGVDDTRPLRVSVSYLTRLF